MGNSQIQVINCDSLDLLSSLDKADCIIMDPPDNIGLSYNAYSDKKSDSFYYGWMESLIMKSLRISPIVWLTYYWKHDVEIKYLARNLVKQRHPLFELKTFVWAFTFGQHNSFDCGSNFRFILRFAKRGIKFNADEIRIKSERQKLGDARANPNGRVPGDVWSIPRVTGNSAQRRSWHPTQLPEELVDRIIRLSTQPNQLVVDPFAGTGTTLRVAKRLGRQCVTCDIDSDYCNQIAQENGICLNSSYSQ